MGSHPGSASSRGGTARHSQMAAPVLPPTSIGVSSSSCGSNDLPGWGFTLPMPWRLSLQDSNLFHMSWIFIMNCLFGFLLPASWSLRICHITSVAFHDVSICFHLYGLTIWYRIVLNQESISAQWILYASFQGHRFPKVYQKHKIKKYPGVPFKIITITNTIP